MAQNAITVLNPNPTPPTNFPNVFLGQTPPNAPSQTSIDDGTSSTVTVFAAKRTSVDNTGYPSVDSEGSGTEVVVTAPGSRAECPTLAFSCLGNYTTTPNAQHASSLSPAATTLVSISPTTTVSGAGTQALTATGTGFTKQSVITVNGLAQPTTYVSSTSLTATPTKKLTAGTWPVVVTTAGTVQTASQTWTFT